MAIEHAWSMLLSIGAINAPARNRIRQEAKAPPTAARTIFSQYSQGRRRDFQQWAVLQRSEWKSRRVGCPVEVVRNGINAAAVFIPFFGQDVVSPPICPSDRE